MANHADICLVLPRMSCDFPLAKLVVIDYVTCIAGHKRMQHSINEKHLDQGYVCIINTRENHDMCRRDTSFDYWVSTNVKCLCLEVIHIYSLSNPTSHPNYTNKVNLSMCTNNIFGLCSSTVIVKKVKKVSAYFAPPGLHTSAAWFAKMYTLATSNIHAPLAHSVIYIYGTLLPSSRRDVKGENRPLPCAPLLSTDEGIKGVDMPLKRLPLGEGLGRPTPTPT